MLIKLGIYAVVAVMGLSFAEQRGLVPAGKYLPHVPRVGAGALDSLSAAAGEALGGVAHASNMPAVERFTDRIARR